MKILIVDDEMFARRTYRRIFNSSDIKLIMADNAVDGYELFVKEEPDVLISDVIMAGFDGDWLIKRVLNEYPKANVIVCSSKPIDELLAYKLMGARACIHKPANYAKLMNELKNLEVCA